MNPNFEKKSGFRLLQKYFLKNFHFSYIVSYFKPYLVKYIVFSYKWLYLGAFFYNSFKIFLILYIIGNNFDFNFCDGEFIEM